MKPKNPSENDKPLNELLSRWKVETPLPPLFQEAVWRRIERAERPVRLPVWSVIANWIGSVLPRPALATAYIALLLAVGVTAGWSHARLDAARLKGELSERYVSALDPYYMPQP